MLNLFLPRQEKFFLLFSESAKELVKTAQEFNVLLNNLLDVDYRASLIACYEKQADTIANTIFENLHKTFITPFDHHDIQQITIKLDDISDAINETAQRIALYQISKLPAEIVSLGDFCVRLSQLIDQSIGSLSSLKNSTAILKWCSEIGEIKSESAEILTRGVAALFQTETDIKHLLKLKDIYELSKTIVDSFEDLGNVIKSIILEYS